MYKDDRPPFVLEVDDETDADISAVLADWSVPVGFDMVNLSVNNFQCLCATWTYRFNLTECSRQQRSLERPGTRRDSASTRQTAEPKGIHHQ
jgi:hypothetical protein